MHGRAEEAQLLALQPLLGELALEMLGRFEDRPPFRVE
jgi:hypothetical protein